jgi:hypothetical protein
MAFFYGHAAVYRPCLRVLGAGSCRQLNGAMTDEDIEHALRRIDGDDDGYITLDEFKACRGAWVLISLARLL